MDAPELPLQEWERELLEGQLEEPDDDDVNVFQVGEKLWIVAPHMSDQNVRIEWVDNHWVLSLDKEQAVKVVYAMSEFLK